MKYLYCIPGLIVALAGLTIGVPRVLAEQRPSDSVVTSWFKAALRDDPRIEAAQVSVATENGVVTLTGSTSNLASKNYADKEAKKIKGVVGVVDEINVKPEFRYDWDIAQDIRHRLVNSAFVHSHLLEVNVREGHVTLKGEVDSGAQEHWAEMLASEVCGVKGVANDLIVRYQAARPDKEIASDVIATIARDVYLTGLSITATVNDRVVTLQGSVGNWLQKDREADQAYYVNGVRDVKNDLCIDSWMERGVRSSVSEPPDRELKKSVRDELYEDLRVEPYDVEVDASLGHVTLRGSVPKFYQRSIAEQDARDVVGVSGVTNLRVFFM